MTVHDHKIPSKRRLALLFIKIATFLFPLFMLVGFDYHSKYMASKELLKTSIQTQDPSAEYEVVYLEPENKNFVKYDKIFFNGLVHLTYTRNFDIGFSLFHNLHTLTNLTPVELSKIVLIIQSTALFSIFIFFVMNKFTHFYAFLFIFAGGIGNVSNRFYNGYVIDFISFQINYLDRYLYSWPIFNVADVYVSIGAGIFIVDIFKSLKRKEKPMNETIAMTEKKNE